MQCILFQCLYAVFGISLFLNSNVLVWQVHMIVMRFIYNTYLKGDSNIESK